METDRFTNTNIAFASRSDKELRRAYWMFKLISKPAMVVLGKALVNTALFLRIPFSWVLRKNVFAHFCGGETIADCSKATRILDELNVGTILDYSVEGKETEKDFKKTFEEILKTIKTAHGNDHIPFCVFKVTGIARFKVLETVNSGGPIPPAMVEEYQRVRERVDQICAGAFDANTPVLIDAEESWIQDTIDQLAEEMMEKYNSAKAVVWNTAQMYRHDRLAYCEGLIARSHKRGFKVGLKLVRGAYMEKERDRATEMDYSSPIHATKADSDRDFDRALELCLDNLDVVSLCAGTHNEKSSSKLTQLMAQHGLEKNDSRVYFAQLFGMSDHITFNLAAEGYNVAKYVPYGEIKEVIPYLLRRAEENTSVAGQTSRELSLISSEITSRRTKRQS
jgi:proline dehydrogenase